MVSALSHYLTSSLTFFITVLLHVGKPKGFNICCHLTTKDLEWSFTLQDLALL